MSCYRCHAPTWAVLGSQVPARTSRRSAVARTFFSFGLVWLFRCVGLPHLGVMRCCLKQLEELPLFSQETVDPEWEHVCERLRAAVQDYCTQEILATDAVQVAAPLWRTVFFFFFSFGCAVRGVVADQRPSCNLLHRLILFSVGKPVEQARNLRCSRFSSSGTVLVGGDRVSGVWEKPDAGASEGCSPGSFARNA